MTRVAIRGGFVVGLFCFAGAALGKGAPSCPAPFVQGPDRACILRGDHVLSATVVPASGQTLDCRGNALSAGVSAPVHAIALLGVTEVTVTDCTIDGFPTAVLVASSRGEVRDRPRNAIRGNRIRQALDRPGNPTLAIAAADGTFVEANEIAFQYGGVVVSDGSDANVIRGNSLVQIARNTEDNSTGVVVLGAYPQSPYWGDDVGPSVTNYVINGRLHQVPQIADRSTGNRIENNTVTMQGGIAALSVTGSERTSISGNTFGGSADFVMSGSFGYPNADFVVRLPGTCSGDATRFCDANAGAGCFLEGVDEAPLGTCSPVSFVPWDPRVFEPSFEDNVVENATGAELVAGIAGFHTRALLVQGNRVRGNFAGGILLSDSSLDDAMVTRNRVSGAGAGLMLGASYWARRYGARVTLNDFVESRYSGVATWTECYGYSDGWRECYPYNPENDPAFAAELSSLGRGNYWGRTCAEGGFAQDQTVGIVDEIFDDQFAGRSIVRPSPAAAWIADSHPYGRPVAQRREPGAPCR
jgi:hypothetical protein